MIKVYRTLSQRVYDALLRVPSDVLNADMPTTPAPVLRLDAALKHAAARLQAEAIDAAGRVDYARLKGSRAYAEYRALTAHLRAFDLRELTDEAEKKAFWLNVYNALVIDAVIAYGVRASVSEVAGFFRRAAYAVGGLRFCLDDIEHGILRANRAHVFIPQRQFAAHDPRRAFTLAHLDNRIHFALVCGAVSCPAVRFYDAPQVDAQLEAATRHFIAQHVAHDPASNTLTLSRLWAWYAPDFGGSVWLKLGIGDPLPLLLAISAHLPEGEARALAQAVANGAKVRFAPYDWRLNAPSPIRSAG